MVASRSTYVGGVDQTAWPADGRVEFGQVCRTVVIGSEWTSVQSVRRSRGEIGGKRDSCHIDLPGRIDRNAERVFT